MGSYRMVLANELRFGIQVFINKLHLSAKNQLSSLNASLTKKLLQKVIKIYEISTKA